MNPLDEAKKYGATFTAPKASDFSSLAGNYGATYTAPTTTAAPAAVPENMQGIQAPDEQATVNGDSYSTKDYGILPKIADFLGISKFGTALGRTINNLTGKPQADMQKSLDTLLQSDSQAVKVLHDPTATPEKIAAARATLATNTQIRQDALKRYDDITTAGITNKEVIGSGINLAASLTAGGALGAGKSGVLAAASKAAPTLAKVVGTGAAFGGATGAGNALQQDKSIEDVAKSTALGATVGSILSGAGFGLTKLVQAAGDKIMLSTIKPSKADIADGFSLDTIKKYNLGGSLSTSYDRAESELGKLSTQLNQKLAHSDSTIDMAQVVANTEKSLVGNKLKTFGSNTSLNGALTQLKDEIAAVADKNGGNFTIPDAQLVKQSAGRMGAWQYGVTDPASTAREKVYNAFYTNLKESIEKNSPEGVREINAQMSKLIPVVNAIVRRIPAAERNSALSLTDMLTLTAGMLDPRALAGFGISLAQKSGVAGNILSKAGAAGTKLTPAMSKLAGYAGGEVSGTQ